MDKDVENVDSVKLCSEVPEKIRRSVIVSMDVLAMLLAKPQEMETLLKSWNS